MSKILDLSLCTTSNIALFTAGSFNFLQLSYKEGISSAIRTIIGQTYATYNVYILYGCRLSVVGGNNVISFGALFWNGEVYIVPNNITLSGTTGTIICNLLVVPFSDSLGGDPMTFTATGTSNVHNDRLATFAYGTTHTGTIGAVDFNEMTPLNADWTTITPLTGWGTLAPSRFVKNGNIVSINAFFYVVNTGIVTADLFILPLEYRPSSTSRTLSIPSFAVTSGGGFVPIVIQIDNSGNVSILDLSTTVLSNVGSQVLLDGISFNVT